jgi:hypothetical protein
MTAHPPLKRHVLLAGSFFTGCGKQAPPPTPLTVGSVTQPVAREVVERDEYIGRPESPETVDVRATTLSPTAHSARAVRSTLGNPGT